jgi:hypothetical protein
MRSSLVIISSQLPRPTFLFYSVSTCTGRSKSYYRSWLAASNAATMSSVQLLLDWDSTLTTHDTLYAVAQVGYQHKMSKCDTMNPNTKPWSYFVDEYTADYKLHELQYSPRKTDRTTIAEESAWLASLDQTESRSWNRLEEHMLFTGVEKEFVVRVARLAIQNGEVKLRPGWEAPILAANEAAKAGVHSGPTVAIVSVNWSQVFIRTCLAAALRVSARNEELETIIANMPIFSNEFDGLSTVGHAVTGAIKGGYQGRDLRTSQDKLQLLHTLAGKRPVVYVGDSTFDFDALLAADYGISVRDEPMKSSQKELLSTFERVGVEVRPLSELIASSNGRTIEVPDRCARRRVWWTTRLDEIAEFIKTGL